MTTLSLEASKKVFEIVGEYETEKCWEGLLIDVGDKFRWRVNKRNKNGNPAKYPAPNFSEVVRVLPKMQKATGNNEEWASAWCRINATAMVIAYMQAPTEQEGLRAVENILMEIK